MFAKSAFLVRSLFVAAVFGSLVACTFDQPSSEEKGNTSSAISAEKKSKADGGSSENDASVGEDGGVTDYDGGCRRCGEDGGVSDNDAGWGDDDSDGGVYDGDGGVYDSDGGAYGDDDDSDGGSYDDRDAGF